MVKSFEWPTIGLLLLTYAAWAASTLWLVELSVIAAILVTGVVVTQHSSLQHEAIHGHPTPKAWLNNLLVWPPLSLFIPFLRFRDTHLDHHLDSRLTDPFDDPETNFLDAGYWDRLPRIVQLALVFNNSLLGRLLVGPLVGLIYFLCSEWRARSDVRVLRGWLWHIPMVAPVVLWVVWSPMPVWAYLIACYIAHALLKVRTFLEHRAHELSLARSVVVEDRGPLALLFLNNNLHVVHHMHPGIAWYRLPALYREGRERFLDANEGYRYRSYGEVFRRYFFAAKDPVAHPFWRRE